MNLLINEWRKFFHRLGLSITFPILEYVAIILYLVILSSSKVTLDADSIFKEISLIAMQFIIFLGIILSATTLTNEFSKGTIKFLLTRPYDRHKVLLAKLGSIATLMPGFMLVSAILNYLLELIITGKTAGLSFVLKQSGISILAVFIATLFFGAFSLLITSLINSSALATAITIIYFILAPTIWILINMMTFKFPTDSMFYKLFPLNANDYMIKLLSAPAAQFQSDFIITLVANIVYFCIFYIIADFIFYRKDISLSN